MKVRILIFIVSSFIVWCYPPVSFAGGAGTSGATLLKEVAGARQSGMGEAFTAVADDVNALHYNPAGLLNIPNREINLLYLKSIADTYYYFISYAQKTGEKSALGISIFSFNAGTVDLSDGPVVAEQDFVYTLGYGFRFSKRLFLGANAKLVQSTLIEKYQALAFAGDIGILYKTPIKNITVGGSIQNYGTELKFISAGDPLPLTCRMGISYRLNLGRSNRLLIAGDGIKFNDSDKVKWNTGIEYWFKDILALRFGYKFGYDLEAFSFGAGFNLGWFKLDFGQNLMGEMEDTTRVSLGFYSAVKEKIKIVPAVAREKAAEKKQEKETVNFKAEIETLLEKAKRFALDKKYREAVTACDAALKIDSQNIKAENCKKEIRAALEKEILPAYSKIKTLYYNGGYREALEKLGTIRETDLLNSPRNPVYGRIAGIAEIFGQEKRTIPLADIIRRAVCYYIDGKQDLRLSYILALRASEMEQDNKALIKFISLLEAEDSLTAEKEKPLPGMKIIDYKLYAALQQIYEARYDSAIRNCEDVLVLEPDNITALKRIGSAYFAMGNVYKAREAWERALKIVPEDIQLKEYLERK